MHIWYVNIWFGSIRFGSGLFGNSSVLSVSVRTISCPGSTRFGLRFLDVSWLGPVLAGSRIIRFGSVRLGLFGLVSYSFLITCHGTGSYGVTWHDICYDVTHYITLVLETPLSDGGWRSKGHQSGRRYHIISHRIRTAPRSATDGHRQTPAPGGADEGQQCNPPSNSNNTSTNGSNDTF